MQFLMLKSLEQSVFFQFYYFQLQLELKLELHLYFDFQRLKEILISIPMVMDLNEICFYYKLFTGLKSTNLEIVFLSDVLKVDEDLIKIQTIKLFLQLMEYFVVSMDLSPFLLIKLNIFVYFLPICLKVL